MKIDLSKEQYQSLAKTVYLGNWMANAHRTGEAEDPYKKEYEEIKDTIFSFAPQFGLKKDFEESIESEETMEAEEIQNLCDEYDEEAFWEKLTEKLGAKDFAKKYSHEKIEKMSEEEYFAKMEECILLWEKEFETHGLERLGITR